MEAVLQEGAARTRVAGYDRQSVTESVSQPAPLSIPQLKSTLEKDNNDTFFIVMCLAVFTCRLRLMADSEGSFKSCILGH